MDTPLRTLSLPPAALIKPKPIRDLAATATDLRERAETAHREAVEAEQVALPEARDRDAEALADSIKAGGKDPGPKHAENAERDLAEKRRNAAGLKVAAGRAVAELEAAIVSGRPDWLKAEEERTAELRAAFAADLEKLADSHRKLREREALIVWLQRAPEGRFNVAPGGNRVHSLIARNGEGYRVESVLEALRQYAQPPEPPREPLPPTPLRQRPQGPNAVTRAVA